MTTRLLLVGGIDPTGAAGLLADLRAAAAVGAGADSVPTAETHQDNRGVWAVRSVGSECVGEAVRRSVSGVDAVKTGLLPDAETVRAVARSLPEHLPLVVDPVLAASSGGTFLDDEGIQALTRMLLPLATLVVPNRQEAARLTGIKEDPIRAGEALVRMGARAVVVTGGDGPGATARDWFVDAGGAEALDLPRMPGGARGTGCAFATVAAAGLADGKDPLAAVTAAKDLVHEALVACAEQAHDRLWTDPPG